MGNNRKGEVEGGGGGARNGGRELGVGGGGLGCELLHAPFRLPLWE